MYVQVRVITDTDENRWLKALEREGNHDEIVFWCSIILINGTLDFACHMFTLRIRREKADRRKQSYRD